MKADTQLLKNVQQLAKQVGFKPHKGIDGKGQPIDIRKEFNNEQFAVFLSRQEKGLFENIIFIDDLPSFTAEELLAGLEQFEPYSRMEVYRTDTKEQWSRSVRLGNPDREYLLSNI